MGKQPKKTMPAPARASKQSKPFVDPRTVLPAHDTSGTRICWRFSHMDNSGPWGLSGLDAAEISALVSEMVKFESMTMHELFNMGEEPGKDYDVHTLPNKKAKERLVEMGRADMTRISRLRVGGQGRLYGFRLDNVFHIVWWDPNHEIFPAKLKHT